jgi:hypothetical protein
MAKHFLPFIKARAIVRRQGIQNLREWKVFASSPKRPANIPTGPWNVYKGKGWKGLGDWLGTGAISKHNRQYLDYEAARNVVLKLGIRTQKEWQQYIANRFPGKPKRPQNIPSDPYRAYKGRGWICWEHWFGKPYFKYLRLIQK